MKSGVVLAMGVLILMLAACGGGEGGGTEPTEKVSPMRGTQESAVERTEGGDGGLSAGCRPRQVANLVISLGTAVAEGRRDVAIGYLSKGKGFVELTIYHGKEPGAGRVDSHTPAAAYDNFINTFGSVENPVLLGSAVAPVGPFEWLRKGAEGDDPTAGVEFALRLGARSLTGKIGIDCATETIYAGAMDASPGLRPRTMCGGLLSMEADRPKICAISTS
jgi:hypothetical protein